MVKTKRKYVCQACGSVTHRWQGQCADCAEWNTLIEDAPASVFSLKHDLSSGGRAVTFEALDAPSEPLVRRPTGLAEFDRALGGGLVPGSAVLMGGDPGIGKSTLLLQAAATIARSGADAVYVSGEEAAGQVRMRAGRLGLADAPIRLAAATSVRDILTTLGQGAPPA
ncbi:MAG: ATPase domain-containing protein, partial [Tsuneonella sp.]